MSEITYLDLVTPVRDIGNGGKRTGFTSGEGYVIESIDGGAAFKLSHPERAPLAAARRIPITNVASYGDAADEKPRAKRAPAAEGAEEADDLSVQIRREPKSTVIHFGRAPEPAPAADEAPKKKAKRA